MIIPLIILILFILLLLINPHLDSFKSNTGKKHYILWYNSFRDRKFITWTA